MGEREKTTALARFQQRQMHLTLTATRRRLAEAHHQARNMDAAGVGYHARQHAISDAIDAIDRALAVTPDPQGEDNG